MIRIRPDGTFDWAGTSNDVVAAMGMVRRQGNWVFGPFVLDGTVRVVWSEFTSESSKVLLMYELFPWNPSYFMAAYHHAELTDNDEVDYWVVEFNSQEPPETFRYKLIRTESDGPPREPL